jgi:STE24 endopeptidase
MIKNFILTLIIGFPVLALFLKIIEWGGEYFYFYLCIFAFVMIIIFVIIFPILIMPLFNKYTDLQEGTLKTRIEELAS